MPLQTVKAAIEAGQCVTRADRMETITSSSIHKGTPSGETLYIGSPQSETLLRIYDKRAELQAKGREDWESYGIRWELQLKQERAQVCGQVLAYIEETDWLEFVIGVLRAYVDFRDTSREEPDDDRYRSPLLGWWKELTDGFRKGRLVVEKDTQSIPKVKAVGQALRRADARRDLCPPSGRTSLAGEANCGRPSDGGKRNTGR